jgi:hypothetical protein
MVPAWHRSHTDQVKPFFRVAMGFLAADYLAGVVARGVALMLLPSRSCNGDLGCIIAGTFNLFLALAAFVVVALGSAAMLSVAASQLAPRGRRVLAAAIHFPLLVGTVMLAAYLANDIATVVLVVPVVAATATAAITTRQHRARDEDAAGCDLGFRRS